jgi:hypothetical protein
MPKKSKKSKKERATDIPSWAKGSQRLPNETLDKAVKRIMDEQYGKGNWEKGAGTEYSQIKKHLNRK